MGDIATFLQNIWRKKKKGDVLTEDLKMLHIKKTTTE